MGTTEKSSANTTPVMADTLAILEEHTQHLVEAIQQEKEKIIEQALEESDKIISEAENKAQQIIKKAVKDAENQSAGILTRSMGLVDLMIDKAEKSDKAVAELKQNAAKEIEKSTVKLRQEADVISEIISDTEKIIDKTTEGLQYQFEESVKIATEARKELDQAAKAIESITYIENEYTGESGKSLKETTPDAEEIAEFTDIKVHEKPSNQDGDKTFAGTLDIEVLAVRSSEYKKLQERLTKIMNLEVLSVDDAEDEKKKFTLFLSKPLPLIKILNDMALVTKATANKGSIQVELGTDNLWRD